MIEKIRKSLVFKTALLFTAAAVFPYLLTSLIFFNSSRKALYGEIVKGMGTKIGLSRDTLDAKLFLIRGNAAAWAGLEVMKDILTDDVDKRIASVLEGLKRDYALAGEIYAVNQRGRIVASSNPVFTGREAEAPWLSAVLSGRKVEIDAHTSGIDGNFVISFGVPVRPSVIGTRVIGALILEYRLKELEGSTLSGDIPFAAVLNKSGEVVAAFQRGTFRAEHLLSLIKTAKGDVVISPAGYIIAAADSKGFFDFTGFGWKVVMAVEEEKALYPVRRIERISIAVGLLGMILILGLVSFFAAKTVRPLKELSETADYIAKTKDLSMKVNSSAQDEIGMLANAFNNMADEVKVHIFNLQKANIELLEVLGSAIAKRDSDTNMHNYRVTSIAIRLAEALGLKKEGIRALIKGSFLHDAGKIGISDNILTKAGRLTEEEFEVMKGHVRHGMDIISNYHWLNDAADVVLYHHEKYDGSGYMAGLKGKDIPFNARIFTIADVFDALTSARPYKKPLPFEETMLTLEESSGTHFDPELLKVFKGIAGTLYIEISAGTDNENKEALDWRIYEYFYKN